MGRAWEDPEAPWWTKLRRARIHINEVRQLADALREAGAWSVQREPAGPDGWAYRFRVHRAIPADLAAVAVEAVANMRSALDHIAYELARRHAREWGDAQETATEFPICIDEEAFRQFFTKGKKDVRVRLHGNAERRAPQCVQPFALRAEARALGVERPTEPGNKLPADQAHALNALWNIDKHRRLPGRPGLAGAAGGTTSGNRPRAHRRSVSVRIPARDAARWASPSTYRVDRAGSLHCGRRRRPAARDLLPLHSQLAATPQRFPRNHGPRIRRAAARTPPGPEHGRALGQGWGPARHGQGQRSSVARWIMPMHGVKDPPA
jgi:hypothetical protein